MQKKAINRAGGKADRLATLSDRELARLLRQSHRIVRPRRARRGRGSGPPPWTPDEDRLLGQWPDAQVARMLGRTTKGVQGRRLKLGLRHHEPPPRWTPEEDRLIDPANASGPIKLITPQLAKLLGRSVVAVRDHRRHKFGASYATPRKWTPRELRLLGTRRDREIAARLGRTLATVQVKRMSLRIPSYRARQQRRWDPANDPLLGTQTDTVLALRFRLDRHEVSARRCALGIPRYTNNPWTAREEALIGTLPDQEVAQLIGRTLESVKYRRTALNRPPAPRTRRPSLAPARRGRA